MLVTIERHKAIPNKELFRPKDIKCRILSHKEGLICNHLTGETECPNWRHYLRFRSAVATLAYLLVDIPGALNSFTIRYTVSVGVSVNLSPHLLNSTKRQEHRYTA